MTTSRMRKLRALAMLVSAVLQPAFATAAIARVFAVGLHAGDHEHSVSFEREHGHRHLVLSHVGAGDPFEHATASHDQPGDSFSGSDHVVEISDRGLAYAPARRSAPDPVAACPAPVASSGPSAPLFGVRVDAPVRARDSEHLRTVVLLI